MKTMESSQQDIISSVGPNDRTDRQEGGPKFVDRKLTLGLYTVSLWVVAAVGTLFFSVILHIVAYATPGWVYLTLRQGGEYGVAGIWQLCFDDGCQYYSVSAIPDAYRCVQAFATLAMLGLFACLVLSACSIFYLDLQNDDVIQIAIIGGRAINVVLLIIAFSVWSAHWEGLFPPDRFKGELGYSFALEILCFVLELAGAGLHGVDFMFRKRRMAGT